MRASAQYGKGRGRGSEIAPSTGVAEGKANQQPIFGEGAAGAGQSGASSVANPPLQIRWLGTLGPAEAKAARESSASSSILQLGTPTKYSEWSLIKGVNTSVICLVGWLTAARSFDCKDCDG